MFCSLYNNMKRSRNIPRFHSKQACMSMTRCEGVRVARWFLALFGEQSFIFVQDLNTSFHNIHKTPLTRSGFEIMFLYCTRCTTAWIAVKLLDVKIYIWLLTSVTRAQPHAPSRLSGGEHGLIPEQRLDTEARASFVSLESRQACLLQLTTLSGILVSSQPLY